MDTFQDTHYKIDIESHPDCLRKAEVVLSAEEVRRLRKKALKAVSKQISIPGFRKGKVPDAVIEEQYAPQIEREWKESVLEHAVHHGLTLAHAVPVNRRLVGNPKLITCDLENGGQVSFAYEVYPALESIDLSQFTLPDIPERKATPADVDEKLQELRQWKSTYEPIDKVIEVGDRVTINLTNLNTGSLALSEYRVKVEHPMAPWLISLLTGMRAGESKDGQTEGEDSFPCTVTVCDVLKEVLPEVDQAFAETFGASSVEELHTRLEKRAQQSFDSDRRLAFVEALHQALIDTYPIELPQSWVEAETDIRLKKEDAESKTEEQCEAIRQGAIRALRLHFLRQVLAEQLKINVTSEEVKYHQMLHRLQNRIMEDEESVDSQEHTDRIRVDVLLHKASQAAIDQILSSQVTTSSSS